jgi:hypothetical protein
MSQIAAGLTIMDSSSIVLDPDKEKITNPNHTQNISTSSTNLSSQVTITGGISTSTSSIQQSIEKLSRPIVFDKVRPGLVYVLESAKIHSKNF